MEAHTQRTFDDNSIAKKKEKYINLARDSLPYNSIGICRTSRLLETLPDFRTNHTKFRCERGKRKSRELFGVADRNIVQLGSDLYAFSTRANKLLLFCAAQPPSDGLGDCYAQIMTMNEIMNKVD